MSTAITETPVGDGEQLGGGVFKFSGNPSGGYFGSADNTPIPRFGAKSWVMLVDARQMSDAGNITIANFYNNSSNYLQLFRVSSGTTYRMRLRIDNTERVSVLVSQGILSCYLPLLFYRDGNTFGIATITLNSEGVPTFSKNEQTVDLAGLGAEKINANIAEHASGRMYFGYDGSAGSTLWNGTLSSLHVALCDDAETLADYGLNTDAAKMMLMYDHQRLFSQAGFSASQVRSFGNWCDSSGSPKSTTQQSQLASGDRLVCPFSSTFLTLGAGAASSNALTYPAYHMPANQPFITARGSRSNLDSPSAIEYAGGWIVAVNQRDSALNPSYFAAFLGPDGEPNRWPIHIPVGYVYEDSSDGDAIKVWHNTLPGVTAAGDTHCCNTIMRSGDCLAFSMYLHSGDYSNTPASGDLLYAWPTWTIFDDDGPEVVWPVEPDASAFENTQTYSLACRNGGKILAEWRSSSSAAGRIMASQFDEATRTFETLRVISNNGNRHNYPGWPVVLPDGRRLMTGFVTNHDNNIRATQWGLIAPRPDQDFDLNTNWFSLTGQPLDGLSGRPELGQFNLFNNPTFHLLDDNDAFFPNLPLNNAGMDFMRIEMPQIITGQWEGIGLVVRVSEENGDRSLSLTGTSGSVIDPWHRTEIRRFTYDRNTPSLTHRDTFDISSILATLNPGDFPQEDSFTTAIAQHLEVMQVGPNRMLLFIVDPEDVAIADDLAVYGGVAGFTLRGALFHKMNAADPTQYVEFLEVPFTLPTDNSEGYGFYPFAVGMPNDGSQSVLLNIIGGDWDDPRGYGNRVLKAVDLSSAINAALATVAPPRARSIYGSPIFSE